MLETLRRYSLAACMFQLRFDMLDKSDILCQLLCSVCSSCPVVVVQLQWKETNPGNTGDCLQHAWTGFYQYGR
jgi:hypothetical protein